jgi:hypothetical protein
MLKKSASVRKPLFGLSRLFGLFGFSGSSNKTNQIDQMNQMNHTKRTAFLSILRGCLLLVSDVRAIEVLPCRNGFPAAC